MRYHRKSLGIVILGCQRPHCLLNLLSSLTVQNKDMQYPIHIFLDIPYSSQNMKYHISCIKLINEVFPQAQCVVVDKHYSTAVMMIDIIMPFMISEYQQIIFIEDDSFLCKNALSQFTQCLKTLPPKTLSVYGDCGNQHPYSFHGIMWGTRQKVLTLVYSILYKCHKDPVFKMKFINKNKDKFLKHFPGAKEYRLLTDKDFFEWGAMTWFIATVLDLKHQRTPSITVYHTGVDDLSMHLKKIQKSKRDIHDREAWLYF